MKEERRKKENKGVSENIEKVKVSELDKEVIEKETGLSVEQWISNFLSRDYDWYKLWLDVDNDRVREYAVKYWEYFSELSYEVEGCMIATELIEKHIRSALRRLYDRVIREENIKNNSKFLDEIFNKLNENNLIYVIVSDGNKFKGKSVMMIKREGTDRLVFRVDKLTISGYEHSVKSLEKALRNYYIHGLKPKNDNELLELLRNIVDSYEKEYEFNPDWKKDETDRKISEELKEFWDVDFFSEDEQEKSVLRELQFHLWASELLELYGFVKVLDSDETIEGLNYRFKSNVSNKVYQIVYDCFASPKAVYVLEE